MCFLVSHQDGGTEGLLLALPLRAVFEEVLTGLDLVLAPLALDISFPLSTGGTGL